MENILKEAEAVETRPPSTLSKINMAASIGAFIISLIYVVFVAGAQAETIRRNSTEIENLKAIVKDLPNKGDVNRLDSKMDNIMNYLLNQPKQQSK